MFNTKMELWFSFNMHDTEQETNVNLKPLMRKELLKLITVLTEQYGVPHKDAINATSKYLRDFRACPDNPGCDLDLWRIGLWNEALGKEHCHLANDIYLQWLELRYHYLAINPDILSLLSSLRKHYLLGLITNGPSRAQWEKVERLQLRNYFDCILVSGDLPWEKPDQKIFQEACQHLSVEPRNCIMVGDKLETDIQGGKEAELGGTVWVPLATPDPLDDFDVTPDFTIDNVTELLAVLPRNFSNTGDHFASKNKIKASDASPKDSTENLKTLS